MDYLKRQLQEAIDVTQSKGDPQAPTIFDAALARAVAAERRALHGPSAGPGRNPRRRVSARLEEELDWLELAALPSRELELLNT